MDTEDDAGGEINRRPGLGARNIFSEDDFLFAIGVSQFLNWFRVICLGVPDREMSE